MGWPGGFQSAQGLLDHPVAAAGRSGSRESFLWQAKKPQRMSGWCGVEYNMIVSRVIAGQMAGKFIEGSNFRGAGKHRGLCGGKHYAHANCT
jgi:hypothetical protein